MGSGPSMFSDLWSQLSSVQEARLLMVGLDAAGKTTILYRLKLDQIVTTLPTVGFNVETVEYKNLRLTVWDLGGQEKIRRKLWRQYYFGTQGVIFVVDSSDQERIEDAQEELQSMLKDDDLAEAPLLVYANKQDLPEAMDSNEVAQRLGLTELRNRRWYVQSCTATTGEGLEEGIEWLASMLQKWTWFCQSPPRTR
mmetsp:Transcript_62312/g.148774  ORF Transcript_62312/g.148774 Transcript_62312/m.148774 type:complete len:196 (-) Transcript_62312:144-731(-)